MKTVINDHNYQRKHRKIIETNSKQYWSPSPLTDSVDKRLNEDLEHDL